jgi:hypothetical protein
MRHPLISTVSPCLALLLASCGPQSPDILVFGQQSSLGESEWSEPVNLGALINSPGLDQGPELSGDDLALYFSSGRPGGHGGNDIWVARRASIDSPWEAPQNLGSVVNTSANEGSPGLSRDGLLLFIPSNRPGGSGGNDIYVSRRSDPQDDFGWSAPVSIGTDINTAAFEAGPKFVRVPGHGQHTFVYFNRTPTGGTADIYAAPIGHDGLPLGPATLVAELSDPATSDNTAAITNNGKEAWVATERPGTLGAFDVWLFTRQNTDDPWGPAQHLNAPLNTASVEFQLSLSHDGRTLFFASTRPGGLGNFDIWMSTR